MTVSDNTTQVEVFSDFFKILGRSSVEVGRKLAKSLLKNLGRALDFTANVASFFPTETSKADLSILPEVFSFYFTGKGLYFRKFVRFYAI